MKTCCLPLPKSVVVQYYDTFSAKNGGGGGVPSAPALDPPLLSPRSGQHPVCSAFNIKEQRVFFIFLV